MLVLFVFKQKTAYEMRISDWSSDVCSSDLPVVHRLGGNRAARRGHGHTCGTGSHRPGPVGRGRLFVAPAAAVQTGAGRAYWQWPARSEEHTSELQSLMRISYAVFCLKKKNKTHSPLHNPLHLYTSRTIPTNLFNPTSCKYHTTHK